MKLCVLEVYDGILYARENEQRLLRNMDVHVVVLDLLKIPYDKVSKSSLDSIYEDYLDGRYPYESYYEISS
jgi:hypothetical protein